LLIPNEHRARGVLDEEESFIDATFATAKGRGADVGPTKRGKGLKIMAVVDRHGLPLSVSTHAANHHEIAEANHRSPLPPSHGPIGLTSGVLLRARGAIMEDMKVTGAGYDSAYRR
jgi:hypothetical protein